jgi:hypothetical protein
MLISIVAKDSIIKTLEIFALSFIIGSGIFSLSMLTLGILGIPLEVRNIILPWFIVLMIFSVYVLINKLKVFDLHGIAGLVSSLLRVSWHEMVFVILISLRIAYSFIETLIKPVWGCDSFVTWSMRAKIFFYESGLSISKAKGYLLGSGHTDYPINIPLLETWTAKMIGRWDDVAIKIIFPLMFLSFIIIFYSSLRKFLPRFQSLVGTYLLTALPLFTFHSTTEYADLPVSIYFISGFLFLLRYIKGRKYGDFVIFCILSALAAWTKNEGLMLFIVNLFMLGTYMFMNDIKTKERTLNFIIYFISLLAISLPWYIFRAVMGVPTYGDQVPQLTKAVEYSARIPIIINSLFNRDFLYGHWGISWFVFFIVLIFSIKNIMRIQDFYPLLAIFLCFIAFFLIYYLTNSYVFLIDGTAVNRNTLIYMPLLVFYISMNLPQNVAPKKSHDV